MNNVETLLAACIVWAALLLAAAGCAGGKGDYLGECVAQCTDCTDVEINQACNSADNGSNANQDNSDDHSSTTNEAPPEPTPGGH